MPECHTNGKDELWREILPGNTPDAIYSAPNLLTDGSIAENFIESTDGDAVWTTIGVSTNIIDASWQALNDAYVYGLLRASADP